MTSAFIIKELRGARALRLICGRSSFPPPRQPPIQSSDIQKAPEFRGFLFVECPATSSHIRWKLVSQLVSLTFPSFSVPVLTLSSIPDLTPLRIPGISSDSLFEFFPFRGSSEFFRRQIGWETLLSALVDCVFFVVKLWCAVLSF